MCRFPVAQSWLVGQPIYDGFDAASGIVVPLNIEALKLPPDHVRAYWVNGDFPQQKILTTTKQTAPIWSDTVKDSHV